MVTEPLTNSDTAGRPMKVMILSMEYTAEVSGGLGTHVYEIANGLTEAGIEVVVLACASGKDRSSIAPNLAVYQISPSAGSLTGAAESPAKAILGFNRDLADHARRVIGDSRLPPDIIQCYSWLTYPSARELGHLWGTPVLSIIQYISEPIERWWGQTPDAEIIRQEEALFRDASEFVTVSRSMSQIIQATHGVSESRIHVVYNGLDTQAFMTPLLKPAAIEELRRAVATANEKVVLFAGRLHPHKGVAAFLDSASRVVEERPDVRYLLAGDPDSLHFAQMVPKLMDKHKGLRAKVTSLGKVPRRQLAALYQIADIAVVPSVYEPFGYVAIEAMAAGVPVVATKVGGLAEIVIHGETGLHVAVRKSNGQHVVDTEELTAAQMILLGNPSRAREMGVAGYRRVRDLFSAQRMARATIDVYRSILRRNQAG